MAGDTRLSTAPDDIVADDVVAESVDIAVIYSRGMTQDYADTTGVGDCAILDDPVFSHPRADSARLQFQHRGGPVCGCMHEMKAIDCDVFQARDLWHEYTFANVNLSQLRVRICFAKVRPDNRYFFIHPAMPALLSLVYFFGNLFFVKRFTIEINIPTTIPLAVIQPAPGDVHGVGIVIAEK